MTKKVDEALATLSRVVPTRFQGEVAVVKAEIERLNEVAKWHRQATKKYALTSHFAKKEIERLRGILESLAEFYDWGSDDDGEN